MVEKIMEEFLGKECQNGCLGMDRKELLSAFEGFRTVWVDKMINLVIAELGVDPETARQVRQNPSNYMITYDTFKLLTFSWPNDIISLHIRYSSRPLPSLQNSHNPFHIHLNKTTSNSHIYLIICLHFHDVLMAIHPHLISPHPPNYHNHHHSPSLIVHYRHLRLQAPFATVMVAFLSTRSPLYCWAPLSFGNSEACRCALNSQCAGTYLTYSWDKVSPCFCQPFGQESSHFSATSSKHWYYVLFYLSHYQLQVTLNPGSSPSCFPTHSKTHSPCLSHLLATID